MSRKTQRFLRKLFQYLAVVIIACLVILGVWMFTDDDDDTQDPVILSENASDLTEAPQTDPNSGTAAEAFPAEAQTLPAETAPTVPAVDAMNADQLVDRYYEAKINDDAESLNEIVDSEKTYNVAELVDETQIITSYDNFQTYVIPGLTDDYMIVYVRYDIFFNGITTGAPALNHFIVAKEPDGTYVIYDRPVSAEFQAYIEETENSEMVQNLKREVDDELTAACEMNEDLKYLIAMLSEEPGETETEPQEIEIIEEHSETGAAEETSGSAEEAVPAEETSSSEGDVTL